MIDFTVIIGVDAKHLKQLSWTIQTWIQHKPSLFDRPWIVFYDREDKKLDEEQIWRVIPHTQLGIVKWPPENEARFEGDGNSKWTNPQRHKMLAGYVHIPAELVQTPYWLKLDTDAIAMGDDFWIRPEWFDDDPVFIGSPWPYTKPPDQVVQLDRWAEKTMPHVLLDTEPLNLVPKPGWQQLKCKRLVSWCAFFKTEFSRICSASARSTCDQYNLPVPSQDGFFWYMAKRMGLNMRSMQMKRYGWQVRTSTKGIQQCIRESLGVADGV